MFEALKRKIDGPAMGKVALNDWYLWMSFDVIGDLALGELFDCLTETRHHPWAAMLMKNLRAIVFESVTLRFPPLQKLLRFLVSKKDQKGREDHYKMSVEKVERRMRAETSRPDILSYVLAHNEEKGGMTRQEIHVNSVTLIGAGSETTATLISGATWYLLRNPACLERIKGEVRGAFKTCEEITVQGIGGLEYFDAVVNETHRMYPAALSGQPRRAPAEGAMVSGYWVPGGVGDSLPSCLAIADVRMNGL